MSKAALPDGWKIVRFKKLFDRLTRKNTTGNKNVLTISARHGLINQDEFFNKSIASSDLSNYYLLERGDFAYNKSYSAGYNFGAFKRLTRYDSGVVSPLYICFTVNDNNKCPEFYVHYFESMLLDREVKAFAQEGARNHGLLNIAVDDFFSMKLPIPPLREQQTIAEILTSQEHVIEAKTRLLDAKKRQKRWFMQKLLTGNWKTAKLNALVSKCTEKNNDFVYSLVLTNSAQNGIIPQSEHFDKKIASNENIDGYYIVADGEFVYNPRISVTAPCGPIRRNRLGQTGVMSPLYTVFKAKEGKINAQFLEHYFMSTKWHRYMKSIANYGARHDRMNISSDGFYSMPIPVPAHKEQSEIAEQLTIADREIELLTQELEQQKLVKKYLMQQLLTGKKCVKGVAANES